MKNQKINEENRKSILEKHEQLEERRREMKKIDTINKAIRASSAKIKDIYSEQIRNNFKSIHDIRINELQMKKKEKDFIDELRKSKKLELKTQRRLKSEEHKIRLNRIISAHDAIIKNKQLESLHKKKDYEDKIIKINLNKEKKLEDLVKRNKSIENYNEMVVAVAEERLLLKQLELQRNLEQKQIYIENFKLQKDKKIKEKIATLKYLEKNKLDLKNKFTFYKNNIEISDKLRNELFPKDNDLNDKLKGKLVSMLILFFIFFILYFDLYLIELHEHMKMIRTKNEQTKSASKSFNKSIDNKSSLGSANFKHNVVSNYKNDRKTNELKEDVDYIRNIKKDLEKQIEHFDNILKEEKDKLKKSKLEVYVKSLNDKVCDMLVEERNLELEREKILIECKDQAERKRLQRVLSIEKTDANEKILKFSKEMDDKIMKYKLSLANNYK